MPATPPEIRLPKFTADAACADYEPELWWVDLDRVGNAATLAIEICDGCPVRVQCLEHALSTPEVEGIWGGKLPHERRRAVRQRRREVA